MPGSLFMVCAPSGGGKTSIVKAVLERDSALRLSISFTTRPPRPGELEGTHYHFVDDAEFARMKAREKARRYGPRRVSVELKKSGVGEALAREVVQEEFAGRSEVGEARSAAARRYNGRGSDAEARRVYGFLVRRGYSAEVCAQVAREYREPPEAEG